MGSDLEIVHVPLSFKVAFLVFYFVAGYAIYVYLDIQDHEEY